MKPDELPPTSPPLGLQTSTLQLAHPQANNTQALQAANHTLREARRAAFNLMEDAVAARQQAEAANVALRESELRLRVLSDNLPDSAVFQYVHDAAGNPRFLYISAGIEHLLGVRAEDVLHDARTLLDQLPPEYAQQLAEANLLSARELSDITLEMPVMHLDGRLRCLRVQARPRRIEGGQLVWDGVQTDITERKLRERNLGFLADLQKAFTPLTSAADSMRVASQRIAELLELNHCVLAEIDATAQIATVLHDHHRANAHRLEGVYRFDEFLNEAEQQELAAGRALVINDVRNDDRTTQRIEHFAALQAGALVETSYAVDGHLKFVLVATCVEPHNWAPADVELLVELAARLFARIERARAEERLVESEERMRLAAEAASFGLYDRDLRGSYFHVSAKIKQILGYPPDVELSLEQVLAHIHPDDRLAGVLAFKQAIADLGDSRLEVEQRIVRHDGVVRWVANFGRLKFKDKVAVRSLGFWVDITDRKEAQAVLQRRDEELRAAAEVALASKYKSEFLANMSHELRTPLNSLLILSQLLADNKTNNLTPKQVEFAQTMHGAGSDLLRLIDDILDLSRIEAGQVEVYVETIVPAQLAEKIERDFRHVARSRQLDFTISVDTQLPPLIRSDAPRVEQVLKNLLANSFKFTGKGSVRLAIGRAERGWNRPHASLDGAEGVIAFAVSDSGIGIAPDKQQLIFEAFTQADGTTSRKYGGTGLGLSISREIASLLGGAITLTSQPGAGSTFTLYLPFTYEALQAAPQPISLPLSIAKATGAAEAPAVVAVLDPMLDDRLTLKPGDDVLLMVESDLAFAARLQAVAHRHGFKVVIASLPTEALQLAHRYQPMALTLCETLPDLTGWTLCKLSSVDLLLRHIPVHLIASEDERPRGLRQGAASHLQKPASDAAIAVLFERIRTAHARVQAQLLVVEDDPAMRWQLEQSLGAGADLKITFAASAELGLAQLEAQVFDCVVLDLCLPDMSGYEFLKELRYSLHIDALPVIVHTGMNITEQQQASLRQLAESVLVKDVRSLDRLLDQTSLYLHRRLSGLHATARTTLESLHSGSGRVTRMDKADGNNSLAGMKMLVVDDDMRNVFALFALLENAQIEASLADNGIQCLEILATNSVNFDAVLMDIMMPVMDGYETMRRIRRIKGFEALPVIALTAKAMPGDRERCIEAGATDYLTKPVNPQRLLAMLRYWMQR
ncbi:response regulator [Roseateles sp. GG27B]